MQEPREVWKAEKEKKQQVFLDWVLVLERQSIGVGPVASRHFITYVLLLLLEPVLRSEQRLFLGAHTSHHLQSRNPETSLGSPSSKSVCHHGSAHFSLCLIIPNWKKNCLANQLASPPLRCPSNPALGGDSERRRTASSALQRALRKGRRHSYTPRLAAPPQPRPHPAALALAQTREAFAGTLGQRPTRKHRHQHA